MIGILSDYQRGIMDKKMEPQGIHRIGLSLNWIKGTAEAVCARLSSRHGISNQLSDDLEATLTALAGDNLISISRRRETAVDVMIRGTRSSVGKLLNSAAEILCSEAATSTAA